MWFQFFRYSITPDESIEELSQYVEDDAESKEDDEEEDPERQRKHFHNWVSPDSAHCVNYVHPESALRIFNLNMTLPLDHIRYCVIRLELPEHTRPNRSTWNIEDPRVRVAVWDTVEERRSSQMQYRIQWEYA